MSTRESPDRVGPTSRSAASTIGSMVRDASRLLHSRSCGGTNIGWGSKSWRIVTRPSPSPVGAMLSMTPACESATSLCRTSRCAIARLSLVADRMLALQVAERGGSGGTATSADDVCPRSRRQAPLQEMCEDRSASRSDASATGATAPQRIRGEFGGGLVMEDVENAGPCHFEPRPALTARNERRGARNCPEEPGSLNP